MRLDVTLLLVAEESPVELVVVAPRIPRLHVISILGVLVCQGVGEDGRHGLLPHKFLLLLNVRNRSVHQIR